ncbi:MAG: hypothetical protein K2H85_00470, partial [Allobaculum sp.]|nr:hypothetical protein [Allobaculum sp.]
MKKVFFAFIVMIATIMGGCTQYNGHIGPIFGSWSLDSIAEGFRTIEIEAEPIYSLLNELVHN